MADSRLADYIDYSYYVTADISKEGTRSSLQPADGKADIYWLGTNAVYVFDVFAKKTRTLPVEVKRRSRQRLRQLHRDLRGNDG